MKEQEALFELRSFWFDLQYYDENITEIGMLIKEINKLSNNLNDMELKKYDTTSVKYKIKTLRLKQHEQEETLREVEERNNRVKKRIDNMPQPYKNILFLKYIKNNTFDEIAVKMHYSNKRIYQLHKKAVDFYLNMPEDDNIGND